MDATGLPSDDTAEMLRDSLRGFLEAHWAAGGGKERPSPDDISAIWRKLIGQGVAALGAGRDEGGLREILVVMAELGRAACPAPMWSAALANLALSGSRADAAEELLEKLHAGTAVAAFSFGARDPDAGAGSIRIDGSRGTGVLRFVEAASATHLLVAVDESHLALVQLDAPGIVLAPTRAMGAWGLCEVTAEFGAADACFRSKAPISTISASRPRSHCWGGRTARPGGRSNWPWTMPRSVTSSGNRSQSSRRSSTSSPMA